MENRPSLDVAAPKSLDLNPDTKQQASTFALFDDGDVDLLDIDF